MAEVAEVAEVAEANIRFESQNRPLGGKPIHGRNVDDSMAINSAMHCRRHVA